MTDADTSRSTPMSSAEKPFFAVEVGSTIKAGTGRFSPSIIKGNITRMLPSKSVVKSMTGDSSYVYTDSLNQGSMGFSGSYGVSAVTKVAGAVSVYVGNASAQSGKTIRINYNVKTLSGVEIIDFNDLTVEDLLNALQQSPKHLAAEALSAYLSLTQFIGKGDLLKLLRAPQTREEAGKHVKQWLNKVHAFFEEFGDGVVVGTVWGGMGTVTLDICDTQSESIWKYGGKGSFSYVGIGTAVSLEAAYDGGQSKRTSTTRVSVTSCASGDCVSAQIDEWRKAVEGKAFDSICEIKLLEKAPGLDKVKDPPKIPEFCKPERDKGIADKIGQIQDLKGLKALAIASAYDAAKKDPKNENLTLAAFLQQFQKKPNAADRLEPLAALQERVENNNVDVAAEDVEHTLFGSLYGGAGPAAEPKRRATPSPRTADGSFTVLGVWVANWCDIFPWLSTAYLNDVADLGIAESNLRKQTLIQDLLALSRLYRKVGASQLVAKDFGIPSFDQVADSFSHALDVLRGRLSESDAVSRALSDLSESCRDIYRKWNEIKFLRGAELGLGVLYDGKLSVTSEMSNAAVDGQAPFLQVTYKLAECGFMPRNYSAFCSFLKLVPFIAPNGDIFAFGPANRLLRSIEGSGTGLSFTNNSKSAMKLEVDGVKKILGKGMLELYPVPYEAARNVAWKGQSFSTNLSSMGGLKQRLSNVARELESLDVYTLSSSNWKADWKPEAGYSLRSIKTQYVGIVDESEVPNVFGG